MHKIVFLDRATISPQITLRRPAFPHTLAEYQQTAPDEVPERLAGATIVIVNKVQLSERGAGEAP